MRPRVRDAARRATGPPACCIAPPPPAPAPPPTHAPPHPRPPPTHAPPPPSAPGPAGTVAIITKDAAAEGCTRYAQGGVCAVLDPLDSVDRHVHDTMVAGAFLNDPK